jgi:hypothetical protein
MNVPEFVHLNDVKNRGDDFFADIWVRRTQIQDQQSVSYRCPDGSDSQLKLTRHVHEGAVLRIAGLGVGGRGFLVLNVRLIDF